MSFMCERLFRHFILSGELVVTFKDPGGFQARGTRAVDA
jgi:hypothetical protein